MRAIPNIPLYIIQLLMLYYVSLQSVCGLPIFHYFSAVKIVWLMENCFAVKEAIDAGNCLFGTIDTWLLWVRNVYV